MSNAISARSEYACLAMLELAVQHVSGSAVCASEIAARHGIPEAFLVQIMRSLKASHLVESVRGAGGGYRLTGRPSEISVANIVVAVEGRHDRQPAGQRSPYCDALSEIFDKATAAQSRVLSETKLSQLIEHVRAGEEVMYHI